MRGFIGVINQSTLVSQGDASTMTRAVARQVKHDFAPTWGLLPVPVVLLPDVGSLPPGGWPVFLLDDPDQANALGYHGEAGGLPYARVFARPVLDNGGTMLSGLLTVSSVLSHEVLEAVADPSINRQCDTGSGYAVALEVGDPVEDQSYSRSYGVWVSDFVLPDWFDPTTDPATFTSFNLSVSGPFVNTPGGYQIQITTAGSQAVFGDAYPSWRRDTKGEGSRTAKRLSS